MRSDDNMHLDPGRITASLVDENDLAEQERHHLESCPACSEARRLLAAKLHDLSENSAQFTPVSRIKVELPALEPVKTLPRFFGWPVGAVAVMASVTLVLALVLPQFFPGAVFKGKPSVITWHAAQEEALMAEVQQIVDSPLAAAYDEIIPSGVSTLDDDAFDYMDPMETMPNGSQDGMEI